MAVQLKVLNSSNEEVAKIDCNESIFKAPFKQYLLHDYVVMQRRARRQGTASTKTRAEVSGTGKKPFKQKGTGQARQGTLIGPHQPGGGIAFGPKPRDYTTQMNKKTKLEALRVAFSQKNYEGKLAILDSFEIKSGKTNEAFKALSQFSAKKSVLIIGIMSDMTKRAFRNLTTFKAVNPKAINVLDILKYDQVLLTKEALEIVNERLAKKAA